MGQVYGYFKVRAEKTLNIAHVRAKDGQHQLLSTHLSEVGELASVFAKKVGVENVGRLLGLLHDFGKYSSEFQAYLKSATGVTNPDEDEYVNSKYLKGKIDHSTAGAKLIWQELQKIGNGSGALCGQILALCIASHHSGLIDCIGWDDTHYVFANRMDKDDAKVHLNECKQSSDPEILLSIKKLTGPEVVKEMIGRLQQFIDFKSPSTINCFKLGFFTRFLFSCLIYADRLNSAEFEAPARRIERLSRPSSVPWSVAIDRLEDKLSKLPIRNNIDGLRREISENCKNNAAKPQGIYTLTVPTGGGKTYASLRYALNHAQKHNLERVIYVIPYTSIIEQNAGVIREAIEPDNELGTWVLEHHSNLEPDQQTWRTKLVAENWDAPIVLTTMVQLLETLFSGGTKSVRRLHQLANSVLIFDEIRTLPINCVHIFCNAINFLTEQCKTTVVLCTATQPLLNDLHKPELGQLDIPEGNELAGDFEEHFRQLSRVEIINQVKASGWSAEEIANLAFEQYAELGSCLVIVNTKDWAQKLYQLCAERLGTESLFHLSTNQCPSHRKILLDEIRARLDQGKSVLCVSTQLIEAGVDVDFASVVRFLAGLDSIAQAAGRCNRNGRLKDDQGNSVKGRVFVVNPYVENTGMLKDIQVGKEKAQRVLREQHQDLLSPSAIQQYFRYYFFDRKKEMVYLLSSLTHRNDSILNLLADRKGANTFKWPLLSQAFMEAGKQFKAIDAPTQAVIVQFGEGKKLVAELCAVAKEFDSQRYYQLLRQAQKFSVNVFPNVWARLISENAVLEIQEGHGIYYLKAEYYSDEFGLNSEPIVDLGFLGI